MKVTTIGLIVIELLKLIRRRMSLTSQLSYGHKEVGRRASRERIEDNLYMQMCTLSGIEIYHHC